MTTAKSAAAAAQRSTLFRTIARIGYVVLGILHIVIGVIVISFVTGGGGEPDQGGAMEQIAKAPMGVFWICSIAPPWSASPPPPVATEIAITPMTMCRMPSTT